MTLSKYFLNKVPNLQAGQSAYARRIENLGDLHLFPERNRKMHPKRLMVIADVSKPRTVHLRSLAGYMALNCRAVKLQTSFWCALLKYLAPSIQSLISIILVGGKILLLY